MRSCIKITRRGLLRRLPLAAAPCFVPCVAFAGRGAAPSSRINLGIIGLKKMGGEHVRQLLGFPEVQIRAVCDVRRDLRLEQQALVNQRYAERRRDGTYEDCAAYNEYEHVLERDDIDAVLIAVPDHWHALIAIAACRAGKDVYCEKPLSRTLGEARDMVAAARRYGTVFQTGSQQRSGPEFRRACELVRNGYIGQVRRVRVEVGPASTAVYLPAEAVPPGFDYDRWLGPAPWAPFNALRVGSYYFDGWRRIRDYSGGKMTDWGAHHFDIVQWGLGMDGAGPQEIIPPAGRQVDQPMPKIIEGTGASPADPSWGLRYVYPGGVEVLKDGDNGVRFEGDEGVVQVNRGLLRTEPASLLEQRLRPGDLRLYRSPGHYQDWFECMRTRRRPVCDVEIGARSATVCHLGNLAFWLKRPIRWDAGAQRIVGDEQAARWIDQPMRGAYSAPETIASTT
jgi:predicted dehydrogenase